MPLRTRIEIIANQAVEEDLLDRLQAHKAGSRYTKVAPAFGRGTSGERHGDHIWPEESFIMLVYCDADERDRIIQAVQEVKQLFPDEGIKLFSFEAEIREI